MATTVYHNLGLPVLIFSPSPPKLYLEAAIPLHVLQLLHYYTALAVIIVSGQQHRDV